MYIIAQMNIIERKLTYIVITCSHHQNGKNAKRVAAARSTYREFSTVSYSVHCSERLTKVVRYQTSAFEVYLAVYNEDSVLAVKARARAADLFPFDFYEDAATKLYFGYTTC